MAKVEVDEEYLRNLEMVYTLYVQEKQELVRQLEFSASQSYTAQSLADRMMSLNSGELRAGVYQSLLLSMMQKGNRNDIEQ